MGVVLQAALKEGLPVQSVIFPHDTYIDIGTRKTSSRLCVNFSRRNEARHI